MLIALKGLPDFLLKARGFDVDVENLPGGRLLLDELFRARNTLVPVVGFAVGAAMILLSS